MSIRKFRCFAIISTEQEQFSAAKSQFIRKTETNFDEIRTVY